MRSFIKKDGEKGNRKERTTGEEDAFRVNGQRVDDCVVTREVEHEGSFRTLPLLDVIPARRTSRKRVLGRMDSE